MERAKEVRTEVEKIRAGVNFTNDLHAAFMLVDPKSIKMQLSHKYLFTLSGSAGAKAVRRTLMKLSPDQRQKIKLDMDRGSILLEGDDQNVEHREAFVDAFMDEIEGETLGQMLNYLSSELESSTESNEEIMSKQNVDHIFEEITKVTQSTVDRYLDTILLDTLYRHAGKSAAKETERTDPDGERRCSSASGTDDAKPTWIMTDYAPASGLGIKQRIKDFQRQHLLAAGEALYAVLAELSNLFHSTEHFADLANLGKLNCTMVVRF